MISLLTLGVLSGCMCLPEEGESVMNTGYFGDCWRAAKESRREPTLLPKP